MNQHYEAVHRYDFLTKELLEEDYVVNKLTDQQIADKYGMPSKVVVWRKRQKFGISNRFTAKSNKHAKSNRRFSITKDKALALLMDNKTFEEIADYMGCSVLVAKRRFKELGLCQEQHHAEKYIYWPVDLTEIQKQLVIGSTLGDGTIAKHGAYSCSHSIKQSDYHTHKMFVLASLHSGAKQHAVHKTCGVNGRHHESVHFTTGCNSYLADLRQIYYPHGHKIFNYPFLMEHLGPAGVAYWYMDDGAFRTDSSNCLLCTYGYTTLEQLLMKDLFYQKWGIICTIYIDHSRPFETCHYLFFTVAETFKLFDLIRPYIVPSMRYKIGE